MSRPDEPGAQDGIVEAQSTDLTLEFERIGEEKERLRRLADHLGLTRPAQDALPLATAPGPPLRSAPEEGSADAGRPPGRAPASGKSHPPPPHPAGASEPAPRKVHARRPSVPLSRPASPVRTSERALPRDVEDARLSSALLESLSGFVPAVLFEELKRERDELFFRLAKLEVERPHLEQLRRALEGMEGEVRRLEGEIQRRRRSPAPGQVESLRLAYRRWLTLRRRRSLAFSDYLECRRLEKGEA